MLYIYQVSFVVGKADHLIGRVGGESGRAGYFEVGRLAEPLQPASCFYGLIELVRRQLAV